MNQAVLYNVIQSISTNLNLIILPKFYKYRIVFCYSKFILLLFPLFLNPVYSF